MKTMNILVAMMTIAIGTAAINEASAQNHSNITRSRNTENSKQTEKIQKDNKQISQQPCNYGKIKVGHVNNNITHHTSNQVTHVTHHATPKYVHNKKQHVVVHHHTQPTYIVEHYTHPTHVVVHHVDHRYTPIRGHVVDLLPVGSVSINVDGVSLYCAMGYIFRPIIIDGLIRYLVE